MAGKALKDVVDAWVAREEIRGVREIDRPDGEYSIAFDYNIGDQTFEVFVDVEEEIGFLSVYVYAPIRALESRVDELIRLFNRKNGHLRVGSLEVVGERRSIRYRASMPARPDALLPDDIERLVQLGGDLFHDAFPQMMAVLFGSVSAHDAGEMGKAYGRDQMLN
ncbi:YbjN domain-containing protein [Roseomonas rosulenta]|uniref:YbjN domain-containing protein n=1 Tax=Roseomonas rosulenta TaxID=2748667 RepID=UPI0018DF5FC5|nr:YbjN domain-containing protein [Roseomonas rosulenta]